MDDKLGPVRAERDEFETRLLALEQAITSQRLSRW
jgi:hypothetical protein